jgi:predicted membrane GTPase involved in stress response
MLVSSVDYSSFVGRIGVGKIESGEIHQNMEVEWCDYHNPEVHGKGKITALYQYDGLKKTPVESAKVGDIIAMEKALAGAMKTMLGINPTVHLVAPKSIARSEGKAVRVIDKRKLV